MFSNYLGAASASPIIEEDMDSDGVVDSKSKKYYSTKMLLLFLHYLSKNRFLNIR